MATENEFDQTARLQERCRQLELVNDTQFLLIRNLEQNIRELISKTDIMKSMIDVVNDRVTETKKECNPVKYWDGGPR